jgi:hypothetical protein
MERASGIFSLVTLRFTSCANVRTPLYSAPGIFRPSGEKSKRSSGMASAASTSCLSATSFDYAFEPFTSQQQDGQTQLSNVFVSVGQPVSPGDLIGRLHQVNGGSHTHFAVRTNFQAVCPDPYFTDPARQSILRLLRAMWPGANMCY